MYLVRTPNFIHNCAALKIFLSMRNSLKNKVSNKKNSAGNYQINRDSHIFRSCLILNKKA